MHADIHDGPEHTLQSEAGYIDARPLSARSTKASCNARPDHTLGQFGARAQQTVVRPRIVVAEGTKGLNKPHTHCDFLN